MPLLLAVCQLLHRGVAAACTHHESGMVAMLVMIRLAVYSVCSVYNPQFA